MLSSASAWRDRRLVRGRSAAKAPSPRWRSRRETSVDQSAASCGDDTRCSTPHPVDSARWSEEDLDVHLQQEPRAEVQVAGLDNANQDRYFSLAWPAWRWRRLNGSKKRKRIPSTLADPACAAGNPAEVLFTGGVFLRIALQLFSECSTQRISCVRANVESRPFPRAKPWFSECEASRRQTRRGGLLRRRPVESSTQCHKTQSDQRGVHPPVRRRTAGLCGPRASAGALLADHATVARRACSRDCRRQARRRQPPRPWDTHIEVQAEDGSRDVRAGPPHGARVAGTGTQLDGAGCRDALLCRHDRRRSGRGDRALGARGQARASSCSGLAATRACTSTGGPAPAVSLTQLRARACAPDASRRARDSATRTGGTRRAHRWLPARRGGRLLVLSRKQRMPSVRATWTTDGLVRERTRGDVYALHGVDGHCSCLLSACHDRSPESDGDSACSGPGRRKACRGCRGSRRWHNLPDRCGWCNDDHHRPRHR